MTLAISGEGISETGVRQWEGVFLLLTLLSLLNFEPCECVNYSKNKKLKSQGPRFCDSNTTGF